MLKKFPPPHQKKNIYFLLLFYVDEKVFFQPDICLINKALSLSSCTVKFVSITYLIVKRREMLIILIFQFRLLKFKKKKLS